MIAALFVFLLLQAPVNSTPVEGADLKSRHDASLKRGAVKDAPFWSAFTFRVRPGLAFDVEVIGSRGAMTLINTTGASVESRNLGLFLLHQGSSGRVIRAEIYRLDRPRDYGGYPVYWLGDAPANESLPFLRGLLDTTASPEAADRLVDAIGAHDDPRLAEALRDITRNAKLEQARTAAVSWLGHLPGQVDFLAALVGDERQSVRVRSEAAESLGDSVDPAAMPALQGLYRAVNRLPLRLELIEAIGDSAFEAPAASFLIELAERESVRELRHQAIEELGDMPHERAVPALIRLYDSAKDEETKSEILEALSDADVEPALQKLVAVAQRDPSIRLRKQAIELLGDSEDPAAASFLEQLVR